METIENMPRPEIVLVADTVAREKNIDRDDVLVFKKQLVLNMVLNMILGLTLIVKPVQSAWLAIVRLLKTA